MSGIGPAHHADAGDRSLTDLEEERIVPWGDPGIFASHRARYELVAAKVAGLRVLDIGCGEGYGPVILAATAREVVAIDRSPAAIDHARRRHQRSNLSFDVGDERSVHPSSRGRFDAITCFEVVEHIERPDELVRALSSVVTESGTLFLSTPNRLVESSWDRVRGDHYEHHVSSMSPAEVGHLLGRFFRTVELRGQYVAGNRLHTVLKTLDVFNVRHRLVRSASAQQSLAVHVTGTSGRGPAPSYRFSRIVVRPAPFVFAIARNPRR